MNLFFTGIFLSMLTNFCYVHSGSFSPAYNILEDNHYLLSFSAPYG